MASASSSESGPAGARLYMRGVRKQFGPTVALDGVDLAVTGGEVVALVGENGAGKSTLMKVLSGAIAPDAGRMSLDGKPYRPRGPAEGRRRGVAMIYQELSLAPHLSVLENIVLGQEPRLGPLMNWRRAREIAAKALEAVGRGDIDLNVRVSALPVGVQQQVEIARSMAIGCRAIVFDEPTSSLPRQDIEKLFALIRRLRSEGMAIVYISHFLEEVKQISDRIVVLRDGRNVGEGATAEMSNNEVVRLMVGRELDELYPRSSRTPGEVLLEAAELEGIDRPHGASLQLRRGEIVGIAGLIGAGRTELVRAIFGLDAVKSGRLRVGAFRGPKPPHHRWRHGTGMVSEDRKGEGLAVSLSLARNLTMPRLRGLGPLGLVLPSRERKACEPWIERIPIRCESAEQQVSRLSGGNQQKVAIARLLHADCDILLLDEPTRGIDVGSKAQIYMLIDELARGDEAAGRQPKAILMVSSYLPELLGVCDRVAVMYRGLLGPARPVEELDEHTIMLEATGARVDDPMDDPQETASDHG